MNLIRLFVERRVATLLLALGILACGLAGWRFLPVASLPDVEYPMINVSASLPGASPEVMATSVAAPLERELASIRGLDLMKSYSYEGVTYVQLRFRLDRSIEEAGSDVQAAISHAAGDLPHDLPSPPTFYKKNPADRPIVVLAFTSTTFRTQKISPYVEDIIVPRLNTMPGVYAATVSNPQKHAVRIDLNPIALDARQLSPEDVREAIARATLNRPKGRLDGASQTVAIMGNDQIQTAADFQQIVIAKRANGDIRLSDVANVRDGLEEEHNVGWYNGAPAIMLGVTKSAGANMLATVDSIRASVLALSKNLPPAITPKVVTDRAQVIRASVHDVERTLAITIVLVIVVIFAFLRRFWITAIPALTIPLSLIGTLGVMSALRLSLDNLSLMALTIAVGFVVDDAIVVIENTVRCLDDGLTPMDAAITGTRRVAFTVLSITLSLVAVFIPVFLMGGVVGLLFREFAITVSVAILISAVVALTLTPMLCGWLLRPARPGEAGRPGSSHQNGWVMSRVLAVYERCLIWLLRHRWVSTAMTVLTIALTVLAYCSIPKAFLPAQDNGRIIGNLVTPPGTTFGQVVPLVKSAEHLVRSDTAVSDVTAYVDPDASGDFIINLKPRSARTASAQDIITRLRQRATNELKGAELYLQAEPEVTIDANLGRAAYNYTLVDTDRAELEAWAPKLEAGLKQLSAITDVSLNNQPSGPAVRLTIDRALAAHYGVDIQSVDDTLYDLFGQRRVAELYTNSYQYYAILGARPDAQNGMLALDAVKVKGEGGALIPLSTFAHYEPARAALAVAHTGRFPSKGITFNLAARVPLGDALRQIASLEKSLGKPATLQSSFEGTAGEFQRSLASEPWLIAAAILAIYIVLGILYESFIHPLTILSSLPSAGLGAIAALILAHLSLDVIGIIGILLLIGIVKKNAIMLVDFAIQAEKSGMSSTEAVVQACLVRFRPIMMTTVAALFGALPLVFDHGAGSELRYPLGVSIAGGLVVSQALTLFSTPVIHLQLRSLARLLSKSKTRRVVPEGAGARQPNDRERALAASVEKNCC